jgi:hypothetical protein
VGGRGSTGFVRGCALPSGSIMSQISRASDCILIWRYQGIHLLESVRMTVASLWFWLVAISVADFLALVGAAVRLLIVKCNVWSRSNDS